MLNFRMIRVMSCKLQFEVDTNLNSAESSIVDCKSTSNDDDKVSLRYIKSLKLLLILSLKFKPFSIGHLCGICNLTLMRYTITQAQG